MRESMGATEDNARRRLIAGQKPANVAGRPTRAASSAGEALTFCHGGEFYLQPRDRGRRMRRRLSSYPCGIRKDDAHNSGDLDELDRAIVSQLMEDGRRPFRTIAQTLGVPESTVRFRANRLLREGALRIVAMADPHRVGYEILAIILLRVRPRAHARVVDALQALPEVQYLSSCTGRFDLVLQVVCEDQEALRRLLVEQLPAVGGILESETNLELAVHKFKYAYPNLAR